MSVNLKGRKNAKAEAVQAPQELVMAGGQTPWAGELPGGGAGNPFDGAGLPAMPPPPPSYAPGEEPPAESEGGGRKLPVSKPVIIALAAIVVLAGGYFYLNKGGSDTPTPTPVVHHPVKPAVGVKPPATAGKPGAVKPVHPGVKPGAKPPAAKPPAKAVVKTPKGKAVVGKGTKGTVAVVAPTYIWTAALPGQIGDWAKIATPGTQYKKILTDVQSGLAKADVSAQSGIFGGTATDPYLLVVTGEAKSVPKHGAMTSAKALAIDLRKDGFAVASPIPVSHRPWGGTAACGTATLNDVLYAYCTWNDHNTFGVILAPHRTQSNASAILRMVRGSVEH